MRSRVVLCVLSSLGNHLSEEERAGCFTLYLQITRTALKHWMSLKFGKIGPGSAELATLERLKKFSIDL